MRVFISYARQDQAAVEALNADLERARVQVWMDEELIGGESWWDTILEQIRSCDLYIFALSPNSLGSRACKAELDYAIALSRPLLPVLIRDVAIQLAHPAIARTQMVDYRKRSMESLFALMAVVANRPPAPPLPNPMPAAPTTPMSYMNEFRELVEAPDLTYQKQAHLLLDLKGYLDRDEERDIALQLVRGLRQRRDISYSIAREIDQLLEFADDEDPTSLTATPSVDDRGPGLGTKVKREAEERARREAEQEAKREAKREAEERARREAEQKAKARPNAVARAWAVAAAWRPSRSTAYFATTAVLAILGILLAFLGPESPVTEELTWDVESHTTQAGADLPEGTTGLSPTLLGLDLPKNPIPLDVDANAFDIGPQRLFLAGPAIAEFDPSGEPVRLVRSGGSWWSPLLTIPCVVMVLGALFSFGYGGSLLRSVRRRRGTVRRGELVGMAGVGAVLGGVITVAGWIAGNVPAVAGVLGVVFCLTAAAGLLPYAVAALPQHRGVILAAVPLAFLAVLSITWTAVGISGGGQGDVKSTPSAVTTPRSSTKTTTPPARLPKWQRGTDLPEPLEAAGVTVFSDAVWVVGGNAPSTGRPPLDKVWLYENGWQPGPKLDRPLDSVAVATDGKRLFVAGGRTTDSTGRSVISRDVWVLDGPADDSWEVLNRLPEERAGGAIAWDGQRLVFAGGYYLQDLNGDGKVENTENVNHADVWVWEGGDKWRRIGQLRQQREDLVAATDGKGRVWFVGGADRTEGDRRVPLGAVDLVEKDSITPLSDIDRVRSSAAVWLADRGVCLFGGMTRTTAKTKDSLTNKVVCVPGTASASPTFRPLPPLTLPRAGMGAAVRGKTIWLAGGFGQERKDGPGREGLAVVEVLVL
jgi:TIR domain